MSRSIAGRVSQNGREYKIANISHTNSLDNGFPLGWFVVFAVIVSMLLAHVWLRVSVIKIGYEVSKQNILQAELVKQNRELKLEKATLLSPENLRKWAKKHNLKYPEQGQIVKLNNGKTSL